MVAPLLFVVYINALDEKIVSLEMTLKLVTVEIMPGFDRLGKSSGLMNG